MTKSDIVNMFCGQQPNFHAMAKIEKEEGKGLFNYCDKTGQFKWDRRKVLTMPVEKIIVLYEKIRTWNEEEKETYATRIILNVAKEKRCWCKCGSCGYDELAMTDNYCPNCGKELKDNWE